MRDGDIDELAANPADPDSNEDGPEAADERPARRKRRPQPLGQSIGGVIFGFEQQVWRNVPPPHELVHHARPDDPLPAGDGGFMTLEIPDRPPHGASGSRGPEPELRDAADRATVAMRIREPMSTVDVGALVDRALPAVGARVVAAGLAIDGPPYVRYHDWGDVTADLEIGFPVRDAEVRPSAPVALGPAVPGGEPGRSALPAGRCAVLVHVGPYPGLPSTWGRLMTWVFDQGLVPAGPTWESYVDNPALVEPAVLRTEVVRPVRS